MTKPTVNIATAPKYAGVATIQTNNETGLRSFIATTL
jgi:hypothetical protein